MLLGFDDDDDDNDGEREGNGRDEKGFRVSGLGRVWVVWDESRWFGMDRGFLVWMLCF